MGSGTVTSIHSKKDRNQIIGKWGEEIVCRWLAFKQSHVRKYIVLVEHEKGHCLGKQKKYREIDKVKVVGYFKALASV